MFDLSSNLNIILRAVALLWTLLITALIAAAIHDTSNGPPLKGAINFAMFVAVLSWLATLYGLAANFVASLSHPFITLVLDALAALFTFIAGVVLAAILGARDCGKATVESTCREVQASTAFMWFLFACFLVSSFLAFKAFRGAGGSVRTGPSMSQVGV